MIKKSMMLMIAVMAACLYLPANAMVIRHQAEHIHIMPHPLHQLLPGVPRRVTTAITQPNVKVVGAPPAMALSNLYQVEGHKLDPLQKQPMGPAMPLLPKQPISSAMPMHP
jgi:hypothetical protein